MWTYFLLKEEGKERIKVSSIFVKDMTRDHIGQLTITPFACHLGEKDIHFREV